jgi:hypothetical protein
VLEQRAFAMDHRELCSAMLADWGLPRVFHQPAFFAEQPDESGYAEGSREFVIAHSLHLSSFIAEIFVAEEAERPILVSRLFEIASRLSLDPIAVTEMCDGIVREWQGWGSLLELETAEIPPFAELASRGEAIAASLAAEARERRAEFSRWMSCDPPRPLSHRSRAWADRPHWVCRWGCSR